MNQEYQAQQDPFISSSDDDQFQQKGDLEQWLIELQSLRKQSIQLRKFKVLQFQQYPNYHQTIDFMNTLNLRNNLIQAIAGLSLFRLKFIVIQSAQLKNIENLIFIDCPNLQFIELSRNQIYSINCIAKINLKKLNYLRIEQYKAISHQKLSRSKMRQIMNHVSCQQSQIQVNGQIKSYKQEQGIFQIYEEFIRMSKYQCKKLASLSFNCNLSKVFVHKIQKISQLFVNSKRQIQWQQIIF